MAIYEQCAECAEYTVELRQFKATDGVYMFGDKARSAPTGKVVLCRDCVDRKTGFVWREGRGFHPRTRVSTALFAA